MMQEKIQAGHTSKAQTVSTADTIVLLYRCSSLTNPPDTLSCSVTLLSVTCTSKNITLSNDNCHTE